MINIIIPMAGLGQRFKNAGYNKPKPFIDILGKTMIERVIESLYIEKSRYILIGQKKHFEEYSNMINEIKSKYNLILVPIDRLTEGPAITVLYSSEYLNNDDELVIANSDQILNFNIKNYIQNARSRNLDGSILTFYSQEEKWSYAKINEEKYVVDIKEKKVISEYATVGVYYFNKGKDFLEKVALMIANGDTTNNEYYVAPAYNYFINKGFKIGIYNVSNEEIIATGTPEDLENYISMVNL